MTNDNKYLTPEQAFRSFCPFREQQPHCYCRGPRCVAWKWTAYEKKSRHEAVFSEYDKMFHNEIITKKINTHGCCGMAYKEEIKIHEFVPTVQ